jgi:hypothetical protein
METPRTGNIALKEACEARKSERYKCRGLVAENGTLGFIAIYLAIAVPIELLENAVHVVLVFPQLKCDFKLIFQLVLKR